MPSGVIYATAGPCASGCRGFRKQGVGSGDTAGGYCLILYSYFLLPSHQLDEAVEGLALVESTGLGSDGAGTLPAA